MKNKTIIVSDPDERAIITVVYGDDRERLQLDKIAFEWRGSAALKPFAFAFDLRSLPETLRTATVDVSDAVAATLRDAAFGLDRDAAKKSAKRNE